MYARLNEWVNWKMKVAPPPAPPSAPSCYAPVFNLKYCDVLFIADNLIISRHGRYWPASPRMRSQKISLSYILYHMHTTQFLGRVRKESKIIRIFMQASIKWRGDVSRFTSVLITADHWYLVLVHEYKLWVLKI